MADPKRHFSATTRWRLSARKLIISCSGSPRRIVEPHMCTQSKCLFTPALRLLHRILIADVSLHVAQFAFLRSLKSVCALPEPNLHNRELPRWRRKAVSEFRRLLVLRDARHQTQHAHGIDRLQPRQPSGSSGPRQQPDAHATERRRSRSRPFSVGLNSTASPRP